MLISKWGGRSTFFLGRNFVIRLMFVALFLLVIFVTGGEAFINSNSISSFFSYLNEGAITRAGKYTGGTGFFFVVSTVILLIIILVHIVAAFGVKVKLSQFNANNVVEIEARTATGTDKDGILKIQGQQGFLRLGSNYIEMLVGDVYIAGIMGDEGVNLKLPHGDYIVTLRLVSYNKTELAIGTAANLTRSKGGPLREEILERDLSPKKNYEYSFRITLEEAQELSYSCRVDYSLRKLTDANGKSIGRRKSNIIKIWKNA